MDRNKEKAPLFNVTFYLKSGDRVKVICEGCSIKYDGEELTSYSIKGIQSEQVLFIRITDVVAITSEVA